VAPSAPTASGLRVRVDRRESSPPRSLIGAGVPSKCLSLQESCVYATHFDSRFWGFGDRSLHAWTHQVAVRGRLGFHDPCRDRGPGE
jgi:hypothetical protein